MYLVRNKEKYVVAKQFIRIMKNNIYKYTNRIKKCVY